jgi:putative ABC transport system permease protein
MVDEGYVEALGLRIVAGRNFASGHPTDSSGFLINEAAAALLGWDDPIGKKLAIGGGAAGPIVGVIQDFHYASLHNLIEPAFFPFRRWRPSAIAVRIRPGDAADAVADVRKLWDEFVPQRPFTYSFLDQEYDELYRSEHQMARIFATFSGLALFIACLGLFGLASYVAVQRTREIGIRKVLGATAPSITFLLTREFAVFVLIGFAVAVPLVYVGMERWLESFAYRIDIGPNVFILAGAAVLVVALVSVSFQAIRAALADPVKSLRYE